MLAGAVSPSAVSPSATFADDNGSDVTGDNGDINGNVNGNVNNIAMKITNTNIKKSSIIVVQPTAYIISHHMCVIPSFVRDYNLSIPYF